MIDCFLAGLAAINMVQFSEAASCIGRESTVAASRSCISAKITNEQGDESGNKSIVRSHDMQGRSTIGADTT